MLRAPSAISLWGPRSLRQQVDEESSEKVGALPQAAPLSPPLMCATPNFSDLKSLGKSSGDLSVLASPTCPPSRMSVCYWTIMLASAQWIAADLFISSWKYFFYFFDPHPRSYLPRDLTKFGGSSGLIDHKADTCHSSWGRVRHWAHPTTPFSLWKTVWFPTLTRATLSCTKSWRDSTFLLSASLSPALSLPTVLICATRVENGLPNLKKGLERMKKERRRR